MTDQELQQKISELNIKIDAVYKSVEKIRRYMLITAWVTVLVIALPLMGLIFAIPAFLNNYADPLSNLGI